MSCNHEKSTYYVSVCHKCGDSIKMEQLGCVNLMLVLKHLDTIHPGFKEKYWTHLAEDRTIRNDSFYRHTIEALVDAEDDFDEIHIIFNQFLANKFNLKEDDDILLEVSW